MFVISPKALALLNRVKGDNEMVYVHMEDGIGFKFEGRILDVNDTTFTVEATDGEVVYNQGIDHILAVDVRPFRRFSGYSTAHFVSDFGPGVS